MAVSSAPLLLVIAGPAGSGKSTLCDRLLQERRIFSRVVTTTTRPPRPGEINGIHYHFFSADEFRRRLAVGDFLEWARVHGNHEDRLYGTLRPSVIDPLEAGRSLVLNIDVQGVENFRRIATENATLRLARGTDWREGPLGDVGAGQRLFSLSDGEDLPILELRRLTMLDGG